MPRSRFVPLWAAAAVLVAAVLFLWGVGVWDAVLLTAAVSVQAWAGGYLWRLASERRSAAAHVTRPLDPVEVLGIALAVGTATAALSGALLSLVAPGPWTWTVPSVLAGVIWVLRRLRGQRLPDRPWGFRRTTLTGFVVGAVVGAATIAINLARYPLGGSGPWDSYHLDMLYFEALSTSVGRYGGSDSIFMAGADIRYHWFAYGWAGQIAETVGAQPFATLTRLLPLVALVGCVALVVSWTARLADRWTATVLAAVLLTAGGYLGAANGTILNFDSPSQNLTTLWLLGFLIAALAFVRSSGRWWVGLIAIALVAATAGGKISSAAVALVPLGILAVVLIARRDGRAARTLLLLLVGLGSVAIIYVLFIAGSASGGDLKVLSLLSRASSVQGLDSSPGARGIVLGTVTLLLAMSARWWGLAWLVGDRSTRWRDDTVLGVGLVAAGILPVIVLSQGVNETWFALAASAPLAALSAAGLAHAWSHLQNRPALVTSGVLGVVVAIIVPVVWVPNVIYTSSVRFYGPWIGYGIALAGGIGIGALLGRRRWFTVAAAAAITVLVVAGSISRAAPLVAERVHGSAQVLAPVTDISPPMDEEPANRVVAGDESPAPSPDEPIIGPAPERSSDWTSDEVQAAQFLVDKASQSDIVVTNDTTNFVVPALTGLRTYMSGSLYQGLYGSTESVEGIPERVDASQAFVQTNDDAAFTVICDVGAQWAWVQVGELTNRSWVPHAVVVFENDSVIVLRIDEGSCA